MTNPPPPPQTPAAAAVASQQPIGIDSKYLDERHGDLKDRVKVIEDDYVSKGELAAHYITWRNLIIAAGALCALYVYVTPLLIESTVHTQASKANDINAELAEIKAQISALEKGSNKSKRTR